MTWTQAAQRVVLLLLLNNLGGGIQLCTAARLHQHYSHPAGVGTGLTAGAATDDALCHVQTAVEVLHHRNDLVAGLVKVLDQHTDLLSGRSLEDFASYGSDILGSEQLAWWRWKETPMIQGFADAARDWQARGPTSAALQWTTELGHLCGASQLHKLGSVAPGELTALGKQLQSLREKLEKLQQAAHVRELQVQAAQARQASRRQNRTDASGGSDPTTGSAKHVTAVNPLSGQGVDSEAAKMDHRSGWLLVANFACISVAFALIILLIVFCSPIRGINLQRDEATGEMQLKDHSLSRNFISVILPYWLPTDEPNAGWQFLAIFFMLLVSALSLAFLWAMLRVKVAIMSVPAIFTDTLSGKGFQYHVYLSWKMFILGLTGTMCFPLAYFTWRSKLRGRLIQWVILGLQLWVILDHVFTNFILSFTSRTMQNWMVTKNADDYWRWNRTFTVYTAGVGLMTVLLNTWSATTLLIRWRTWMTSYVLDRYFSKRAYYQLNSNSGKVDALDNPDSRIELEIPLMISAVGEFVFGLLRVLQKLVSTLLILWMVVPYWIMLAVLYSICGSVVAIWFMWHFTRLKYESDRTAADFRFSLVNVRNHAEAIALYYGEGVEKSRILQRFDSLIDYQYRILQWTVGFNMWKHAFELILQLGPNIFLARLYLHGHLDFGGVGQAQGALVSLGGGLSYMQESSDSISVVATSVTRLGMLLERIEKLEGKPEITSKFSFDGSVELRNVMVRTPGVDSRVLLSGLSVRLGYDHGPRRLLIVGRSGVGKSSLLRSIAGLWLEGGGEIQRPCPIECIFLPQQPYMPIGCLRDQLCYPDVGMLRTSKEKDGPLSYESGAPGGLEVAAKVQESKLRALLADVQLGDLPDRFQDGFDHVDDWSRVLSLGEQQRVASIRCMLRTPKLIVLDEATSGLSIEDEQLVYRKFVTSGFTYVSVGHRMTLLEYHDHVLELRGGDDWALYTIAEFRNKEAGNRLTAGSVAVKDG